MIAFRMPFAYIAARTEDQPLAAVLRDALADRGVQCTSRWIDQADLTGITAAEAEMDLADVCAADVFVLLSHREKFRDTTGGHHVETGYAIAIGKPVVIYGEAQNVFHALRQVTVIARQVNVAGLAEVIQELCGLAPNALGRAVTVEPGRGV